MLFGKLLPRKDNFFEMFNQHADKVVAASHAFSKLVDNYADPHLRDQYSRSIDEIEHEADRITHEVNRALHKTFITPFDREQIHSLISSMDDVADLMQDAAETMSLYDVHHMTDDIKRFSEINVKCCEALRDAVLLLKEITDATSAESALKICNTIDQLEDDADRVLRAAMSKLFREEPDVRELIKLKAIYELLESVSDKCEDVSNLIEGVVLENS